MTKDQIYAMVVATFKNVITDNEKEILIEPTRDVFLMGHDSPFDSVDLVTFIVSLEQNIEEEFNQEIALADDRAMSQKTSPFRSIGSICDYIEQLLNQN